MEKLKEEFNPQYMSKLFDLGYQSARNGYPWIKALLGFESPSPNSQY